VERLAFAVDVQPGFRWLRIIVLKNSSELLQHYLVLPAGPNEMVGRMSSKYIPSITSDFNKTALHRKIFGKLLDTMTSLG
jgi:hypothetical protein